MNSTIYRALWKSKNRIFNSNIFNKINKVSRSQFLGKIELEKNQLRKIKKIVSHAYQNTPFYKEKYDKVNFNPQDINSLNVISQIPILTKEEIRLNLKNMISKNIDSIYLKKMYTGGSTGKPLMLYHDIRNSNLMNALNFRMLSWWGLGSIPIGIKIFHIWGLSETNQNQMFDYQSSWDKFRTNYTYFNAFDMSEQKLNQWGNYWHKHQPDLVISYTSALFEFSKFLLNNRKFKIRPKAIWSTSEPLFDFQKIIIEKAFKTKVFSQYGLNEIHHIAADCIYQEGMHINAENRIVEILDQNQKPSFENPGTIVITDLSNYAMPLIRYNTEDTTKRLNKSCSCGNNLPLIDYVTGRICDIIILPDGKKVHWQFFYLELKLFSNEIRNFQVHQKEINKIEIKLIPSKKVKIHHIIPELKKKISSGLDNQIIVTIKIVDYIEKEKSGKFRFIKSSVGN